MLVVNHKLISVPLMDHGPGFEKHCHEGGQEAVIKKRLVSGP